MSARYRSRSFFWRYLSSRRRWPTSMSSPRREWWSFLCERRCSVSSLMRSVSSAICTRVLPVSWAFSPNFATISDLRSWVRDMRRASVSARLVPLDPEEAPHRADVVVHLAHEVVDGREAALPAQALAEVHAQRRVVEVALEVQDVGLDQLVAPGLELRADPDVDRRRAPVDQAGVDPVPRRDVAGGRQEVGGGEAEVAAAGVAVGHRAGHHERGPQQPPG